MPSTKLTTEQINLAIAKIAGWTDIHAFNPNIEKITWQGANEAHPELGTFIPKYTEDLNAIVLVFRLIGISGWRVEQSANSSYAFIGSVGVSDQTGAIALCLLLLAINPDPIVPKASVIDAIFG
jgi:hypothetical protein